MSYSGLETTSEILTRMLRGMKDHVPEMTLDPANPIYQYLKVDALEKKYTLNEIERAFASFTVYGATGVQLDYIGLQHGVSRKDAIASNGKVQCTIKASELPYTVSEDSEFYSETNTYSNTLAANMAKYIEIERDVDDEDYIPSKYYSLTPTGVSGLLLFENDNGEVGDRIPTSYYSVDGTNMQVDWTGAWAGVISAGNDYYLKVTGLMEFNVDVTCSIAGSSGNVSADSITTTNLADIDSVTNVNAIENGVNQETDSNYRKRIVQKENKKSTLATIKADIWNVDGVRDVSVFNNTQVDQSAYGDWNETGAIDLETVVSGNYYGFDFKPSKGVGTLSSVTMYGKASSDAKPLNFKLSTTSNTGNALDEISISTSVLHSKGVDIPQEFDVGLEYGSLDWTRTYRVTCIHSGNSHWYLGRRNLATGLEGSMISGGIYDGVSGIMAKTNFLVNSITASIVPEDGYNFENDLRDTIEDVVDSGIHICTLPIVNESTRILITVDVEIKPWDGYVFSVVKNRVLDNIEDYVDDLDPGDDVIYSQIEKIILQTDGVMKDKNLTITLADGTEANTTNESDLYIAKTEYTKLDYSNSTIGEI